MITDTNVYLGRWPFRRLLHDDTAALAKHLAARQVTQALAGSFEALLHDDVSQVNVRTAEQCRRHGEGILQPVGAVNPRLPGWKEDLRRCIEVHRMTAIRLHPNYQAFDLYSREAHELLALAAGAGLLVQLGVQMEDERTQHPLVRIPPVALTGLPAVLQRIPNLRLQILNASRFAPGQVSQLTKAGQVFLDIAMHEGALGLTNLLAQAPRDRVVFGSCSPLFYFESSSLKLTEAGLDAQAKSAILRGNATRMLTRGRP